MAEAAPQQKSTHVSSMRSNAGFVSIPLGWDGGMLAQGASDVDAVAIDSFRQPPADAASLGTGETVQGNAPITGAGRVVVSNRT